MMQFRTGRHYTVHWNSGIMPLQYVLITAVSHKELWFPVKSHFVIAPPTSIFFPVLAQFIEKKKSKLDPWLIIFNTSVIKEYYEDTAIMSLCYYDFSVSILISHQF